MPYDEEEDFEAFKVKNIDKDNKSCPTTTNVKKLVIDPGE